MPPAAEYFVGLVDGEPACHVAVTPFFQSNAYRATRLVVMPEWQGAGVGTKFLEWVCQYHLEGNGRTGKKLGTLFHTSHPQLCGYLRKSPLWIQKSSSLYGSSKAKSAKSIRKSKQSNPLDKTNLAVSGSGYGGHFRAVQGFKFIGK